MFSFLGRHLLGFWARFNRLLSLVSAQIVSVGTLSVLGRHWYLGKIADLPDFQLFILAGSTIVGPVCLYLTSSYRVKATLKSFQRWHEAGLISDQTHDECTNRVASWFVKTRMAGPISPEGEVGSDGA